MFPDIRDDALDNLREHVDVLTKENRQLRSQLREKNEILKDLQDQCDWLRTSLKDFTGFVDR